MVETYGGGRDDRKQVSKTDFFPEQGMEVESSIRSREMLQIQMKTWIKNTYIYHRNLTYNVCVQLQKESS